MDELKEILKQIVADLEKSAAAIEVLRSGANIELTALDLAVQKNREFYNSLRNADRGASYAASELNEE